mmetsp:Transcript_40203/g.106662  ORF Transcript_40203/g.106662 Transcript_40203/m.106662 type:complete len:201 (+) Transcript_40203:1642-2244(+)
MLQSPQHAVQRNVLSTPLPFGTIHDLIGLTQQCLRRSNLCFHNGVCVENDRQEDVHQQHRNHNNEIDEPQARNDPAPSHQGGIINVAQQNAHAKNAPSPKAGKLIHVPTKQNDSTCHKTQKHTAKNNEEVQHILQGLLHGQGDEGQTRLRMKRLEETEHNDQRVVRQRPLQESYEQDSRFQLFHVNTTFGHINQACRNWL